ncbi:class I SAM-dependent methyltransferase [Haloprofundus halobius]|uniref:class I SAM-dependent methyltransferase n=1 Tax=Haloprofundus halobius TaxID=2876194 RepID=UPI001CC99E4A|nr:class I SAM-dependent methyltransferase [Haloprofundus halobius]
MPDEQHVPPRELTETESAAIDWAGLLANLGKKVLHVGGGPSTEQLLELAHLEPDQHVLDAGCGVGTTAIEIAQRFGCQVTAVDIAPSVIERAATNVRAAGLQDSVTVHQGDILELEFSDDTFDRVIIESVVMFVDRAQAAREVVRVCKPGGLVIDHEAYFTRGAPDEIIQSSQELFPGFGLEEPEGWVGLYRNAGLSDIEYVSGPAEFIGPGYIIRDEGLSGFLTILGRLLTHPTYLRQMAGMLPRVRRVQPYIDYIVLAGRKPA